MIWGLLESKGPVLRVSSKISGRYQSVRTSTSRPSNSRSETPESPTKHGVRTKTSAFARVSKVQPGPTRVAMSYGPQSKEARPEALYILYLRQNINYALLQNLKQASFIRNYSNSIGRLWWFVQFVFRAFIVTIVGSQGNGSTSSAAELQLIDKNYAYFMLKNFQSQNQEAPGLGATCTPKNARHNLPGGT